MANDRSKILVVEDDLSSQQYYGIILEDSYELEVVTSVEEAKAALQASEFSVAIVDLSLPGNENGIDLIKYIREKYPDKPIPIALTAHAFPQNRKEALDAGAAEFFTKPILNAVLIESIEKQIQSIKRWKG